MTKLTQKQEQFCLAIVQGVTQRDAWRAAGYSCSYESIDGNAHRLASNPKILARVAELRKLTEDKTIMEIKERKQRLSEIARARLTDFMELGQDGSWVNIGKETPQSGAIQEIHSRTEYDDNGAHPTVHTSVKLHSPTQAIDLLNKMDRIYADQPQNPTNVQILIVSNVPRPGGENVNGAGQEGLPARIHAELHEGKTEGR